MRLNEFTNDDLSEGVAGPKNCWPGYRKTGTQPGTGKNKGKRVNDCEKIKKEGVAEGWKTGAAVGGGLGAMVGGPIGAIAGAGIGGVAQHLSDKEKDEKRKKEYELAKIEAKKGIPTKHFIETVKQLQTKNLTPSEIAHIIWGSDEAGHPRGLRDNFSSLDYIIVNDLFDKAGHEWDDAGRLIINTVNRATPSIVKPYDKWGDEIKEQGVAEDQQENVNENELSRLRKLSGISIIKEEIEQQFNLIEEMVEALAEQHGVDAEQIWEDFESVDDYELLRESAAWQTSKGKSKSGGLNAKGVASYRRENPGSKLQMAVTTKPSKLKKGSKAAKRRKSFCARMSGVNGPMKKPNGKPTRKALALRKWNC